MISVGKHFWFDDRHEAVLLTDAGVASQHVGVLDHSLVRWAVRFDLEHTAPFGEAGTALLVLSAPLGETVQTLSRALVIGTGKGDNSFVHL